MAQEDIQNNGMTFRNAASEQRIANFIERLKKLETKQFEYDDNEFFEINEHQIMIQKFKERYDQEKLDQERANYEKGKWYYKMHILINQNSFLTRYKKLILTKYIEGFIQYNVFKFLQWLNE